MYSKVVVHYSNMTKDVEMSHDDNILNSLIEKDLPINHSCGGNGSCGTCRILVLRGGNQLAQPEGIELEMILDRKFSMKERLSCQTHPIDGLEIKIPDLNE